MLFEQSDKGLFTFYREQAQFQKQIVQKQQSLFKVSKHSHKPTKHQNLPLATRKKNVKTHLKNKDKITTTDQNKTLTEHTHKDPEIALVKRTVNDENQKGRRALVKKQFGQAVMRVENTSDRPVLVQQTSKSNNCYSFSSRQMSFDGLDKCPTQSLTDKALTKLVAKINPKKSSHHCQTQTDTKQRAYHVSRGVILAREFNKRQNKKIELLREKRSELLPDICNGSKYLNNGVRGYKSKCVDNDARIARFHKIGIDLSPFPEQETQKMVAFLEFRLQEGQQSSQSLTGLSKRKQKLLQKLLKHRQKV